MASWTSRILTWIIAFVVGAVYGTAATIAHAYRLGIVPLGLALALIGSVALLLALRLLTGDRWTVLAGGLGMLGAAVLFAQVGPGGSAVVAPATPETEWITITWSVAVPILVALLVAWPSVPAPPPQRKLKQ